MNEKYQEILDTFKQVVPWVDKKYSIKKEIVFGKELELLKVSFSKNTFPLVTITFDEKGMLYGVYFDQEKTFAYGSCNLALQATQEITTILIYLRKDLGWTLSDNDR